MGPLVVHTIMVQSRGSKVTTVGRRSVCGVGIEQLGHLEISYLTKVTWAWHTLMALDRKVFAPSEVSLVGLLVCQQGVQVVRQLLRAPAEGVYHGARWEEGGEGGAREQDRHSVQLQCIEGLLCDVVGADVVLKGEIEFVLSGHQVKAGVFIHCVRVPQPAILAASLGATGSIDVHLIQRK